MATPATPDRASEPSAASRQDAEIEFARIVAFSDGVFAIAITLLVLALEVPDDTADLWAALKDLNPDFFAYALSFAVVGKFWLSHHRFYGALERFDGTLMGLNILYLAWVVLVPFTSELLGEYSGDSAATIAYAINMAAVSATFVVQIAYAYRSGLIRPEARSEERRWAGPANFLFAGLFVASIPVALVSTVAAQLMWLAMFLVGRRAGDWVEKRFDPPAPR
jgi:uncharacterized membrane protein